MLSKVIFAALCAMVASRAIDLDNYTFDQYVKDFKLKFQSSEVEHRRANFLAELARVKMHNAKNLSWKEGLNKFSAMTPAEKKGYMGRSKGAAGASQKLLKGSKELPANFEMKPVSLLPKHVDWRTKSVVSPVKDQGYCGSCWAFAATEVIESHVALATGKLFDLSPQQIAMCSPNPDSCGGTGGCHGATAEIAFEYVTSSNGLFEEFQYPYSSYYGRDFECSIPELASPVVHINGYVKLPENNYTALMNAIATVGPIAVSVDAGAWSGYESGVFSGCNQQNPDINHAVVLVGYGEENGQKYWLVRNSWSPNWGELGYIKVARLDTEDQTCGIDLTPQDGTACAGDDTPKRVCGTCGMLYDSSYPLEATAL